MPSGDPLVNADVATRWPAVTLTSDSAGFTTEVSILSITGTVTAGQRYAINGTLRVGYSSGTLAAGEAAQLRIREDTASGNQLNMGQYPILATTGNGYTMPIYAEFTASSTGSKTFHLTAQRGLGTATLIGRGSANSPGFLTVELLPI